MRVLFCLILFIPMSSAFSCYCGGIFPRDHNVVKPLSEAGVISTSIKEFVKDNYSIKVEPNENIILQIYGDYLPIVRAKIHEKECTKIDLYEFKEIAILQMIDNKIDFDSKDTYKKLNITSKLASFTINPVVTQLEMRFDFYKTKVNLFAITECHKKLYISTIQKRIPVSCGTYGPFYLEDESYIDKASKEAVVYWNKLMEKQNVPSCKVES